MGRKVLILGVLIALGIAAPALAAEIVYFTNGTSMRIESYELGEGTVRINLGGQAFMEFPREKVERIETTSGQVSLSASGVNRVVPGGNAASSTGYSRDRGRAWGAPVGDDDTSDPAVGTDQNGLAVYRPFATDTHPAKREFAVTGRREAQGMRGYGGRPGLRGTSRVGSSHVLPSDQAGAPKPLIGLERRSGSSSGSSTGGGSESEQP